MTAADWDDVPQPVRAMAVVGMIEYRVRFYEVGAAYELDSTLVMRTVKAVAMSESWFDHRAFYVNADGSADIGIGGASAFARDALRRLHARGAADFTLADDEYDNPWLATRWLAFWLRLSLDEARGDLGLATRAHNVGMAARCGDRGRITRPGSSGGAAGISKVPATRPRGVPLASTGATSCGCRDSSFARYCEPTCPSLRVSTRRVPCPLRRSENHRRPRTTEQTAPLSRRRFPSGPYELCTDRNSERTRVEWR